jgi:hypothetical protein
VSGIYCRRWPGTRTSVAHDVPDELSIDDGPINGTMHAGCVARSAGLTVRRHSTGTVSGKAAERTGTLAIRIERSEKFFERRFSSADH